MMTSFQEECKDLVDKWRLSKSLLEEMREIKKNDMSNDMIKFVNEVDNYFQEYLVETRSVKPKVKTLIEEDTQKSVPSFWEMSEKLDTDELELLNLKDDEEEEEVREAKKILEDVKIGNGDPLSLHDDTRMTLCNKHGNDPCTCDEATSSQALQTPVRQNPPASLHPSSGSAPPVVRKVTPPPLQTPLPDSTTRRIGTGAKHFPVGGERLDHVSVPHVVVMVGLPARGKTYMAKKLTRYLNWIGIKTKVFNLGEYRRKVTENYKNHNFFRADNNEAMEVRRQCAHSALEDVCGWLDTEGGRVAVFDATNTTIERRQFIHEKIVKEKKFKLFYVESICEDQDLIESNIKEVKVNSPDYYGMSSDAALKDFLMRIDHYKLKYQPLDEEKEQHLSFMKLYNTGEKVVVHKHEGHVQARIVYYLMNIHVVPRSIYLSRHGESEFNVEGKIGGDSGLSNRGYEYRDRLAEYINGLGFTNLRVWTSWLQRTIETASEIKGANQERWKALNEIDAGVCEGMTYQQIKDKYPSDFEARDRDKLRYRYPRGESYEDLIARLEPVIMELERQGNVLVVAHQAVLRCLLAYFMDEDLDKLPYIDVPLHHVLKLTPIAYGCRTELIPMQVASVNTHRRKPEVPGNIEEEAARAATAAAKSSTEAVAEEASS